MQADEHSGENAVQIRRGRVDSLSLYEITDSELDTLAAGSPSSIKLNFAIFFLSVAISFLTTLLATDIASMKVYTLFVVLVVMGFAIGGIMLCMWWQAHRSTSDIIKRIRDRIPSEEVAAAKTAARKKPPKPREDKSSGKNTGPSESEGEAVRAKEDVESKEGL